MWSVTDIVSVIWILCWYTVVMYPETYESPWPIWVQNYFKWLRVPWILTKVILVLYDVDDFAIPPRDSLLRLSSHLKMAWEGLQVVTSVIGFTAWKINVSYTHEFLIDMYFFLISWAEYYYDWIQRHFCDYRGPHNTAGFWLRSIQTGAFSYLASQSSITYDQDKIILLLWKISWAAATYSIVDSYVRKVVYASDHCIQQSRHVAAHVWILFSAASLCIHTSSVIGHIFQDTFIWIVSYQYIECC